MSNPDCPYCGQESMQGTGVDVYPHRPDLQHLVFYSCAPCQARVGCHPGTTRPLGNLANAELRAARIEAHTQFDKLVGTYQLEPGQGLRVVSRKNEDDKKGMPHR